MGVYPLFTVQQSERFLSANISRQSSIRLAHTFNRMSIPALGVTTGANSSRTQIR